MALEQSTIVRITATIAAGGVPRLPFGRGLLITQDEAIAAGGSGKAVLVNSFNEANDLLSAGDALDAARTWFSADPIPQGAWLGRWAEMDVSTSLVGGKDVGTVTNLAIAGASFRVGGSDVTVDLSGNSTYAAIATDVAAAIVTLGGIYVGATFTYDTDHFVLTLAGASDIGGVFGPHSLGTGTDVSGLLGMTVATGAVYKQGHDAERLTDAIGEMLEVSSSGRPVAIFFADDVPETYGTPAVNSRQEVAALAETGDYVFAQLDTADQALVTNDDTSESAVGFSNQYRHTAGVYSKTGTRPDIALIAAMSGQNLDNPGSIITPHPKPPARGFLDRHHLDGQLNELKRKRTNVYTNVGGLPSLLGGYTFKAGSWLDAEWALLWLKNRMTSEIFNSQRASRRFSSAILLDTVTRVMGLAVRNGMVQPGRKVSAQIKADIISTTGNIEFDGTLTTGYLVWVQAPSQAIATDLENRIGRFKVWMVGSDAIHETFGDLVFQN